MMLVFYVSLTPEELQERVDEFVESLFDEHQDLPKRMVAAKVENKAYELYEEDDDEWDRS